MTLNTSKHNCIRKRFHKCMCPQDISKEREYLLNDVRSLAMDVEAISEAKIFRGIHFPKTEIYVSLSQSGI